MGRGLLHTCWDQGQSEGLWSDQPGQLTISLASSSGVWGVLSLASTLKVTPDLWPSLTSALYLSGPANCGTPSRRWSHPHCAQRPVSAPGGRLLS